MCRHILASACVVSSLFLLPTAGLAQVFAPITAGAKAPEGKLMNLPKLERAGAEPVKINDASVKEGSIAAAFETLTSTPPTPPLGLKGLTDGFRVFNYSMSETAAAKLNLVVFGGSGAGERRIFVYDFMFYKDDLDAAGTPITWGAGVRLVIAARSISASASFSSLPAIAASAEFKYIETSYNLQTIGLSGPKIVLAVPPAGSYDIEQHVALLQSIDAIRDAALDNTTVVTPRLVRLEVREEETHI